MRMRVSVLGALLALTCLAVTSCGSDGEPSYGKPFALPVGPTTWDAATAPAWLDHGTLHVGKQTVKLGDGVDQFVLGATGAYWIRGAELMFTDVRGATQAVAKVGWNNLAVSADRSVLATVDQSRGPEDRYGTHVIQVAVFDTRTGEPLYRTPDRKPDKRDDLADLYGEIMPLLDGVSDEEVFFDDATVDLDDGSVVEAEQGVDGIDAYAGYAETLFPDGYRVGITGEGRHRTIAESSLGGVGRLSPDRSTLFDVGEWPTPAFVYDATTGDRRSLDAPWDHFTLGGWTDEETFFGVAERIDPDNVQNVLRARQVVTCALRTLECTPVSRVIPTETRYENDSAPFLLEGSGDQF